MDVDSLVKHSDNEQGLVKFEGTAELVHEFDKRPDFSYTPDVPLAQLI